ncbi:MAG: hypothetical protein JNL01_10545 [Bdellovibrionales bacterium]|nr:hypothetical protein [Bdellovibrionales bacterium]
MDGWVPDSSGWTKYYVIFLSAISSLLIPLVLEIFGKSLRKKGAAQKMDPSSVNSAVGTAEVGGMDSSGFSNPGSDGASQFSSPTVYRSDGALGRRMNTRFFLSANAAVLLLTLMVILIPLVGILVSSQEKKVLIAVLTMVGFAGLGLLYSARKGDLDWIQTFHDEGRNLDERK